MNEKARVDQSKDQTQPHESSGRQARLVSLDAFRGFTILGMLLVNNTVQTATTPKHLMHAQWNQGVHFADLVFPWFLYIVGTAIPYAAASARKRGLSSAQYALKAAYRTIMLVLLGMLIDSSVNHTVSIGLGVLQLIGLSYFAAALMYQLRLSWRIGIAAELLLVYWVLLRFVPVPGVGAGIITESHNLVQYINNAYLSALHLRGLLSVIPATALVLIGSATGDLLRLENLNPARKVVYLSLGGAALTLLGILWNVDLPFNKPLWTSSYIVYTAGLGAMTLSAFYFLLDIKGWRAWAFPLIVYGSNAIFAYVAPILFKVFVLQGLGSSVTFQDAYIQSLFGWFGVIWGSWSYTLSYMLFWWLVLFWLYRRKIFLRV